MANEQNLKSFTRPDGDGVPLAEKQMQVRLPEDVDAAIRKLPDRSVWLRRVISEAARRELISISRQNTLR